MDPAYRLLHGRDHPPQPLLTARAGTLELELGDAELRYVHAGGVEILRRVYAAVRDPEWATAPAEVTGAEVDLRARSFTACFTLRYVLDAIDVSATVAMEGEEDGTLRYTFDGVAETDFDYSRIGICILHSPGVWSGRPFVSKGPAGRHDGVFPRLIAQIAQNGVDVPLFPAFEGLRVDLGDGLGVSLSLEGDQFEIEDQRNWTDGSYKTYSTPLAAGWPRPAALGERFHQSAVMTATGVSLAAARPRRPRSEEATVIELDEGGPWSLPALGLGAPATRVTERELALLRSLRLSHMRVDAWPGEAADSLGLQLETARALGTDVELALHLPVGGGSGLEELAGMLRGGGVRVTRVLVFHARELCTSAASIAETRTRLAATLPGVPFYGGTDAWFAQLNIERAGLAQADGLTYSITPQVHAFDEISLVENLAAQADTVATARSFAPSKPIVVSPVTLRPRFNPDTGASAVRHFDTAARADPRQGSLFCAAWTLGSIRYLTAAGADSVTYYEALGPCGVLDGSVFPVFHVFAQLGECRGAAVVPTRSSDPLRAEALVLDDPPHRLAMLASLVPQEQEVVLDGLGAARGHARRISLVTAAEALAEPEAFRKSGSVMSLAARCVQLGPYEVLILELER